MKKTIKTLATLCSLMALIASCAQDTGGALVVEKKISDPGVECLFNTNGVGSGGGTLDISLNNGYTAAFSITTNLPATFNNQDITQEQTNQPNYPNYGNTNANIVIVESADLSIVDVNNEPFEPGELGGEPFQFPSEGNERQINVSSVVANENTTLGERALVFVDIISSTEAQAFRSIVGPGQAADIFVSMRLNGRTSGAGSIRTPAFTFPVTLCNGCLTPPICDPVTETPNLDGAPCFIGQDRPSLQCDPI